MVDPITGAVAGAIASESVVKIREVIESSENPEETWEQSCSEVAVKLRASFEQNEAGESSDDDRLRKDLSSHGIVARELAIYGDAHGFDDELIQTLEDLASECSRLADTKTGIGNTLEPHYRDSDLPELIDDVLDGIGE
jgi:hypothetical protein